VPTYIWKILSSGLWCCVVLYKFTNSGENPVASILLYHVDSPNKFSQPLVNLYQTTPNHVQKDSILHSYCHGNRKSHQRNFTGPCWSVVNLDRCRVGIQVDKLSSESLTDFDKTYNTVQPPFKVHLCDMLKLRKILNVWCVKIKKKILLWILNHGVYSKFKRSDVFIQIILYLYFFIYFMWHERRKIWKIN